MLPSTCHLQKSAARVTSSSHSQQLVSFKIRTFRRWILPGSRALSPHGRSRPLLSSLDCSVVPIPVAEDSPKNHSPFHAGLSALTPAEVYRQSLLVLSLPPRCPPWRRTAQTMVANMSTPTCLKWLPCSTETACLQYLVCQPKKVARSLPAVLKSSTKKRPTPPPSSCADFGARSRSSLLRSTVIEAPKVSPRSLPVVKYSFTDCSWTARAYACTLKLPIPGKESRIFRSPPVYSSKQNAVRSLAEYAIQCGILSEASRSMDMLEPTVLAQPKEPSTFDVSCNPRLAGTRSAQAHDSPVTLLNLAVQVCDDSLHPRKDSA